jgi:hypothetical protein
MARRKNTVASALPYKHVDPAEKSQRRQRTPSDQIRPNVEKALAALKNEGQYPNGRLVAERAGISPDTLYKKAKDLLEQAQEDYVKSRAATQGGGTAKTSERDEKQALKEELKLAWETVDHLSAMLMKIMANAQSLMPGQVYELLAPLKKTHRHLEPF